MKEWLKGAGAGDIGRQTLVASMYRHGRDREISLCDKNIFLALKWYKKASLAKDGSAFFYLGEIYRTGDGIEKDFVKAITYYEQASLIKGYLPIRASMIRIGEMYRQGGYGILKNNTLAVKWFQKAAKFTLEDDNADFRESARRQIARAMFMLGGIYSTGGSGVCENKKIAQEYFVKSSDLGNEEALLELNKVALKNRS